MLKRPQTLSSAGCMYESSKGNFFDRNPLATDRPKHPSSFIPNVVNALLECGVAVRRLYWSGTQKVDDALNEHCALMTKHNETHSVLLTCGQDVGLVAHSWLLYITNTYMFHFCFVLQRCHCIIKFDIFITQSGLKLGILNIKPPVPCLSPCDTHDPTSIVWPGTSINVLSLDIACAT